MGSMAWLYWLAAILLGAAAIAWRPLHQWWHRRRIVRMCRDFHYQRERLEAKFVHLAAGRDAAASAAWEHCHFDDDVAYVRNRATGEMAAFVGVSVGVDSYDTAVRGHRAPVANSRAGTAVFRFTGSHWETDGRALFNLSPFEAIRFYRDDLEMVGQE